jgi:glycosyltransferase involved in cell wall biosynthesis
MLNASPPPAIADGSQIIYIDVTSNGRRGNSFSGIERIEYMLCRSMYELAPARVRFVTWNSKHRAFLDVSFGELTSGTVYLKTLREDVVEPGGADAPWALADFRLGGCFFVIGYMWMANREYIYSVLNVCEHYNLRYCQLIHDLIPSRFPHWHKPGVGALLDSHLDLMLPHISAIVTYSQFTRREVIEYALDREWGNLDPIVIRLGDSISELDSKSDRSPAVEEFLLGRSFILNVASMSPRKNHRMLYDIWVRMANELGASCPPLIIVGSGGWMTNDILDLFMRDTTIARYVLLISAITDQELDWLYRNCMFTVFPTLYEGWGMPVSESLGYGKFCVASNVASVPEIAPGLVKLLDPMDFKAWYAQIRFYSSSLSARQAMESRIRETYRPSSWYRAAEQLLDALPMTKRTVRSWRAFYPGTTINFSELSCTRFLGNGWSLPERWGCWSIRSTAELILHVTPVLNEAVVLTFNVHRLTAESDGYRLSIRINGHEYCNARLEGRQDFPIEIAVPRRHIDSSGRLLVELINSQLLSPKAYNAKSTDRRLLGTGLVALESRFASAGALGGAAENSEWVGLRWPDFRLHGDRLPIESTARKRWKTLAGWGFYQPGQETAFDLPFGYGLSNGGRLFFTIRPVASAEKPLRLAFYVDGVALLFQEYASSEVIEVSLALPAPVLVRRPARVMLAAKLVSSPTGVRAGSSGEEFAVGLFDIRLAWSNLDPAGWSGALFMTPTSDMPFAEPSRSSGQVRSVHGWHASEPEGVWTRDSRAILAIEGKPQLPAVLKFKASSIGDNHWSIRDMNGALIASGTGPEVRDIVLTIESIPGELYFVFDTETLFNPFLRGASADERWLGIYVQDMGLFPCPFLAEDRRLEFGSGRNGLPALGTGWSYAEEDGVWAISDSAILSIVLPFEKEGTLDLCVSIFSTFTDQRTSFRVLIQDKYVEIFDVAEPGTFTFTIAVSTEASKSRPITITLGYPCLVAPRSLGLNDDARTLGLKLHYIEWKQKLTATIPTMADI